jgi:AcrR family transcriptional regulator
MPRQPKARIPLKEAALRLFVERGIDGTGIRELAKTAGYSEAAIYRHWAGKDELVRDLYHEHLTAVSALLAEAISGDGDLDSQIRAASHALYGLFDAQPLVFRFVLLAKHDLGVAVNTTIRTPLDLVHDLAARAVADGRAVGDPALLAAAMTGLFLETAVFVLYGRLPGPLSRHADGVADLVLRLLSKPATPSR